jgi:hypothetical protein
VIGNVLVVRDTSYGDVKTRKFCADARQCQKNEKFLIENQAYFSKSYNIPGAYMVKYETLDTNGNRDVANNTVMKI